jgi:hypothetical protein
MLTLAVTSLLLSACKSEFYDTGDGELSYMKAEMCDITAHNFYVTSIITDEDVSLPFATGLAVVDAPNDTTIRCMLYYNHVPSEPISIMSTIKVKIVEADDTLGFNRADIVSRWESRNKKYINFLISEKRGVDSLYTEKKYYSVVKNP